LCTKYIKNTQSFLWWWQTQLLFGFLDMGQHYFFRIIRFQMWYSKSLCKQLKKGININDLSPVDLRLSIVKPLAVEWLFQTYYRGL
jgi:hypothetical protein